MRDIKFRAWSERNKEMITPYFFVNSENFITQYGSSKPDSVMQFTGLKDKNGRGLNEVYEGDIISLNGVIIGSVYEVNKRKTDLVIPQLGTKAWWPAYKEAVARGFNYSE